MASNKLEDNVSNERPRAYLTNLKRCKLLATFKLAYKPHTQAITVTMQNIKISIFETFYSTQSMNNFCSTIVQQANSKFDLENPDILVSLLVCYLHGGHFEQDLELIILNLLAITYKCNINFYQNLKLYQIKVPGHNVTNTLTIRRLNDLYYAILNSSMSVKDAHDDPSFNMITWLKTNTKFPTKPIADKCQDIIKILELHLSVERVNLHENPQQNLQSMPLRFVIEMNSQLYNKLYEIIKIDYALDPIDKGNQRNYVERVASPGLAEEYTRRAVEIIKRNMDFKNGLQLAVEAIMCLSQQFYMKINLLFINKDATGFYLFQQPPTITWLDARLMQFYFIIYWNEDRYCLAIIEREQFLSLFNDSIKLENYDLLYDDFENDRILTDDNLNYIKQNVRGYDRMYKYVLKEANKDTR